MPATLTPVAAQSLVLRWKRAVKQYKAHLETYNIFVENISIRQLADWIAKYDQAQASRHVGVRPTSCDIFMFDQTAGE